jgi:hypothetical protein
MTAGCAASRELPTRLAIGISASVRTDDQFARSEPSQMSQLLSPRIVLALGAAALAALAGAIASLDGDADIVPFFLGLTLAAGVGAWAVHEPYAGARRTFAQLLAVAWLGVAVVVGGLLVWYQALCGCSFPGRPPEATYLGLTATVYHLAGVFVGGALMVVAAFSRALGHAARDQSPS